MLQRELFVASVAMVIAAAENEVETFHFSSLE